MTYNMPEIKVRFGLLDESLIPAMIFFIEEKGESKAVELLAISSNYKAMKELADKLATTGILNKSETTEPGRKIKYELTDYGKRLAAIYREAYALLDEGRRSVEVTSSEAPGRSPRSRGKKAK